MNKIRQFIGKVFTSNRAGTEWLAILRIGTALSLIGKIVSEFRSMDLLYSSHGLIPQNIAIYSQNEYISTILGLYRFVAGYCSEAFFLKAFLICYLLFAVSLLFGYMTRFAALVCWAMMVIIFNSSHLTSYGFDALLLTLLFYCLIFPVGKYQSMDAKMRAKVIAPDDSLTDIFHKTLQLHVCLIYFVNGISKVYGGGWHSGGGIWDAVNQPQFHSMLTPLFQKLMMIPYLPVVISASVIVIEIAFPFLIWVRKINKVMLILILLLHVFIAIVMGLWQFAFVMIVINVAAFGHLLVKKEVQNT